MNGAPRDGRDGGVMRNLRTPITATAHRTGCPGVEALTLATAHQFPRHSHDDFGVGLLTFGAQRSWSGVGTVEAFPGDLITVNPGEMHDGAPMRGEPRGWSMVYFRPAILAALADEAEASPFEFARPAFRDEPIARAFSRLFSDLSAETPEPLAVEERLLALLDQLLARTGARRSKPAAMPDSLARARQRLDDDPAAAVSLAELAAVARMSRFQLLRAFARHLGATPHAYLVQRRTRLARRLLSAGRTPAQAAVEAGFSDQSHLTRAFVRCFGVTPARFRAAVTVA